MSACTFLGMIASASSDRLNLACSLQRAKSGVSVRTSEPAIDAARGAGEGFCLRSPLEGEVGEKHWGERRSAAAGW